MFIIQLPDTFGEQNDDSKFIGKTSSSSSLDDLKDTLDMDLTYILFCGDVSGSMIEPYEKNIADNAGCTGCNNCRRLLLFCIYPRPAYDNQYYNLRPE